MYAALERPQNITAFLPIQCLEVADKLNYYNVAFVQYLVEKMKEYKQVDHKVT